MKLQQPRPCNATTLSEPAVPAEGGEQESDIMT